MNRRELLKSCAALAAVGVIGGKAAEPKQYGPMTVERHMMLKRQGVHLRVWHNGQDVTERTHYADDTDDGMAELLLHKYGRPYIDYSTRSAAVEIVHGVTFREA